MKKVMMMLAMLAVTFTVQAQQKFHDLELNQVSGPVKSIVSNVMGMAQTITFTKEGKMSQEGMSDAVYDADGYMQSAKMSFQGQEMVVKYTWENGKVAAQTMNVMGNDMTIKRTYNDKGAAATESMNMGGQEMSMPYTDYKYDDHGNWISRKMSMMGQEMEQTRTIEYFE
jgi:hypothetical protein